jgi:PPK2 family polyphosphate:nucleotide phosphotransferase
MSKVDLGKLSAEPPAKTVRERIKIETDGFEKDLAELADLLFFAREHSLLVVFQGLDTSGKDGVIRKVLDFSNAQSVRVESFKVPTELERAHDFLWRVHAKVPARGEIVLFNRSHYEDVIVTRVHKLFPEKVLEPRFAAINDFERLLAASGTIVLKFFLHITKEEQRARLLERQEDVQKAWKLSVGDWEERERWDDYIRAYETAIERCSPDSAPWHVVPANEKWYRNYVVLKTIVEALRPLRAGWLESLAALGQVRSKELREYFGTKGGKVD